MTKYLIAILIISSCCWSYSQQNRPQFYHGITLKASLTKNNTWLASYAIGIKQTGFDWQNEENQIGGYLELKANLFNGYLGTSAFKIQSVSRFKIHFMASYGIIYENFTESFKVKSRLKLLNTDFNSPIPLSSNYSFSLGSSYIIHTGIARTDSMVFNELNTQRVGQINFHIDNLTISYYNDGGHPITDIQLGDAEDKWWTGGFSIGYSFLNSKTGSVQQIELSFDKFTGYTPYAFEVSNILNLEEVMYQNELQMSYNSSKWSLSFQDLSNGLGLGVNWWNSNWDFQDGIHLLLGDAYHPSINKPSIGLELLYNNRWKL